MCVLLGGFILLRSLPVSWDAGACGGGYAAFVFDKYSGELVEKLRSSLDDAVAASSMQAVRGTQTAKWNGRTILLQFDITYRHSEYGLIPTIGANRFDSKQTAEEGAFQFGYAGWRENK